MLLRGELRCWTEQPKPLQSMLRCVKAAMQLNTSKTGRTPRLTPAAPRQKLFDIAISPVSYRDASSSVGLEKHLPTPLPLTDLPSTSSRKYRDDVSD
ncbi:hypothetical protein RvY_07535-2 [Ramazzottius varieornatus]|uniref:Uncharacterized protein n=1 Tax=Ramazzottius varieornatus TaxID=947166 RepID=A0A1D1V7K0_RAMVA|nr:hypothetical protein RvY_07535-2 [Ramazzottius varieornatus]